MADFISGRDVVLRFYQNNAPVIVKAKSITVEEMGTEVADGVNGEDRDRFQNIRNGFRISLELYKDDKKVFDAIMAEIANDDAGVAQLNKGIGIRFKYRDGTSAAYVAKEVTFDPWTASIGGRTERVMQSVKMRARYFSEVQAV